MGARKEQKNIVQQPILGSRDTWSNDTYNVQMHEEKIYYYELDAQTEKDEHFDLTLFENKKAQGPPAWGMHTPNSCSNFCGA